MLAPQPIGTGDARRDIGYVTVSPHGAGQQESPRVAEQRCSLRIEHNAAISD